MASSSGTGGGQLTAAATGRDCLQEAGAVASHRCDVSSRTHCTLQQACACMATAAEPPRASSQTPLPTVLLMLPLAVCCRAGIPRTQQLAAAFNSPGRWLQHRHQHALVPEGIPSSRLHRAGPEPLLPGSGRVGRKVSRWSGGGGGVVCVEEGGAVCTGLDSSHYLLALAVAHMEKR